MIKDPLEVNTLNPTLILIPSNVPGKNFMIGFAVETMINELNGKQYLKPLCAIDNIGSLMRDTKMDHGEGSWEYGQYAVFNSVSELLQKCKDLSARNTVVEFVEITLDDLLSNADKEKMAKFIKS